MAKKETTAVAVRDEALIAELNEMFPKETGGFTRIQLPRLSFVSQDQTEGKGKSMVVTAEAGTFFTEKESGEVDEAGKKVWNKTEIGSSFNGIILYHRYQLSYYDEATEKYTSSPVYDSQDEIIPLWSDKKEVAKGTPAELKAQYQFVDKDGKTKSKLKDNRILYVMKDGEVYQLNLHGSSMYSFMTYARNVTVPTMLTTFSSEPQEKGSIQWNMMTFKVAHPLSNEELLQVRDKVRDIKQAIIMEKGSRAETPKSTVVQGEVVDADEAYEKF